MQNYVTNDPNIRAAYMAEQEKQRTKWKIDRRIILTSIIDKSIVNIL